MYNYTINITRNDRMQIYKRAPYYLYYSIELFARDFLDILICRN